MFFSKHDHNISYINHYGGLLEVKGEGVLFREDADVYPEPNKSLAEAWEAESMHTSFRMGIFPDVIWSNLPVNSLRGCMSRYSKTRLSDASLIR